MPHIGVRNVIINNDLVNSTSFLSPVARFGIFFYGESRCNDTSVSDGLTSTLCRHHQVVPMDAYFSCALVSSMLIHHYTSLSRMLRTLNWAGSGKQTLSTKTAVFFSE